MPAFRMYPLSGSNVLKLFQQRDEIDLNPPYQRLSVWDADKQRRFIDSVINGVDTPKLYLHEIARGGRGWPEVKFSVIDGKQRLLALWAFMRDEITLPDDFVYFRTDSREAAGLKYTELLGRFPMLRAQFDTFDLPVVLVQAETDEFIEQLFSRLNIQVPLTAPEARNVLGGPIPLLIRKVVQTAFFDESVPTRNNRFQHHNLAAKFLYIVYRSSFAPTKKRGLDEFVRSVRDQYQGTSQTALPGRLQRVEDQTKFLLDKMHGWFRQKDPLLRSVGRATLYFHIFRLCIVQELEVPISRTMLEEFNQAVDVARDKSQRRATGADVQLSEIEEMLLRFDQEKQSINDGNALRRQYHYLNKYMICRFDRQLPDSD